MDNELRFAILIDADNVSDKYIKIILDETANNGIVTYKRIYGDWTTSRLAPWKNILLDNSIIPIQQYSYTVGKNSTDSAMIIDAMDILYSGNVDGFCIVSSDSDFTRLAARLRESGMQVIGMGEEKTPKPFISACNQFKYLDLLYSNQQKEEKEEKEKEEKEVLEKAPALKAGTAAAKAEEAKNFFASHGMDKDIEMDGGINEENAAAVQAAGVNILVAGNTVFRSPDKAATIRALREARA